jgi:hypothetical protein
LYCFLEFEMSVELMRPVTCGLIGGIVAIFFCHLLSRWVPHVCNGKDGDALVREYRPAIWLANFLWFGGLMAGTASYGLGYFPNTDWHGLALGFGGGSVAALMGIPLAAVVMGKNFKEAYVAFAISQQAPLLVVYGILVFGVAVFGAASVELIDA